jgi:hypothetical protein
MKENNDFFNIVIVLIIAFVIIYLGMNILNIKKNVREGLTNQDSPNGEAGNAANFAAAIKAQTVILQDSLLIPKYRADYENVIINMEDYLNMLMLKQILNIDTTKDAQTNITNLSALNTISTAKNSLNEAMTFLDKQ